MRLIAADPAVPLCGPRGETIGPEGVEVDDLDVFWNRRLRSGEAVIAPASTSSSPKSRTTDPA